MEIAGEYRLRGSREQVWALLNDEGALARCTPGCEQLTRTSADCYAATLKMGLAAVKGTYEGTLRVADKQVPESLRLQVEAKGTTGWVTVDGQMALTAEGEAATQVAYRWEINVGGPIAMVGQRVLGGVARWIVGEFFGGAVRELAARQSSQGGDLP
jgi:uncharacterized protein